MKLTADSEGRLGSAELFRPKADFEATVQLDGSVRLVELTQIPVVKPRRVDGRSRGADVRLSRETIAAAVRAERRAMIQILIAYKGNGPGQAHDDRAGDFVVPALFVSIPADPEEA
jgi:hypothetical protein